MQNLLTAVRSGLRYLLPHRTDSMRLPTGMVPTLPDFIFLSAAWRTLTTVHQATINHRALYHPRLATIKMACDRNRVFTGARPIPLLYIGCSAAFLEKYPRNVTARLRHCVIMPLRSMHADFRPTYRRAGEYAERRAEDGRHARTQREASS